MGKVEIYLDLKPGAKHGLTLKDNSDGLVMVADAKDAAKTAGVKEGDELLSVTSPKGVKTGNKDAATLAAALSSCGRGVVKLELWRGGRIKWGSTLMQLAMFLPVMHMLTASGGASPWQWAQAMYYGFDAVNPYREIGERAHASTDFGRASLLHVEPDFLSDMAVVNVRAAANHILLMSEVEPLPGTATPIDLGSERVAKLMESYEGGSMKPFGSNLHTLARALAHATGRKLMMSGFEWTLVTTTPAYDWSDDDGENQPYVPRPNDRKVGGGGHRSISFLIYLTPDGWRAGDGGQLRLTPRGGKMREVAPAAGTLVLFDAETVGHEMAPVVKPGHLAVVGWFYAEGQFGAMPDAADFDAISGGAAALREKVKARMMPTVVEAKKTWSDPPVDEKEVDEWGEVEDEEY